jgi:hypothetical protein
LVRSHAKAQPVAEVVIEEEEDEVQAEGDGERIPMIVE